MSMKSNGLVKLLEELGELSQVAAKLLAYPDAPHPDGTDLEARLIEELGDVLAAISFVADKLALNESAIVTRCLEKTLLYVKWDDEPNESDADSLLKALVEGLERSFISSWQTTAGWSSQQEAARKYLNRR
jgi:hypothetical protein